MKRWHITLALLIIAAAPAITGGYLAWDHDNDGWSNYQELFIYRTDLNTPNPNAKYFVDKGGSIELVPKIAVLDVKGNDGTINPDNKDFIDYLFNPNLVKLSPDQAAQVKSHCIDRVLKDGLVSKEEASGLHLLSQYPGKLQAEYSNFSESVLKYLYTLTLLNDKDFADYAIQNKLRMKCDGLPGFSLTDLDIKFLFNPGKYVGEVLDADLKRLESARPDVAAELRKIPDFDPKTIAVKQVEANEDVVYITSVQNPILKMNLKTILDEGIIDKREYSTPLQALVWHYIDNNSDVRSPLEIVSFSLRDLVRSVWKYSSTSDNYKSDRWKNFDEVVDRLNSPLTAQIYAWDNIKYDFKSPGVPNTKSRAQTPLETFSKKLGVCADQSNFLAYVLKRKGYDADILRVDWGSNDSHDVCKYVDKNNLIHFLDNTFTISGREDLTLQGPFSSIKQACERFPNLYSGGRGTWTKCYLIPPNENGFDNYQVRLRYVYSVNE